MLASIFPTNLKKYGDTVLITGASDGIGKAYAYEFAKRGFNLVLVARNPTKLEKVKQDISTFYSRIKIEIIAIDFSDPGDEIYRKLESEIRDKNLEIGILVNNVGIGYNEPIEIHNMPESYFDRQMNNLVNVNIRSMIKVSKVVLNQMKLKNKGLIVNLSSESSNILQPKYLVYGATKHFNDYFSRGLALELKNTGIEVQTVLPNWIGTELGVLKASLAIPTPERYVRHAISSIGYESYTSGFYFHTFLRWLYGNTPEFVGIWSSKMCYSDSLTSKIMKILFCGLFRVRKEKSEKVVTKN